MNGVISYWKLNEKQRKEIDALVQKGILRFESTLFSKPEQDYLNYCLNKSEFVNSLDLRNMYGHGTQPFGDEDVHHSNYIRFLKLFVLIIIKINARAIITVLKIVDFIPCTACLPHFGQAVPLEAIPPANILLKNE